MCSSGGLVTFCVLVGCAFVLAAVSGIGFSLFLVFGDPFDGGTDGTYTPSFEDIGPAFVISVTSLVMSILLIGGAKQGSKDMLLAWVIWKIIAIIIFWLWYGYSELKNENYIDWSSYGMKSCYFCEKEAEKYVGWAGAIASVIIIVAIIPVEILRARLKKRHRELTELTDFGNLRRDGGDTSSSMMRYLQDNQPYIQQDLVSTSSSTPFNQNSYNTQQYYQQNLYPQHLSSNLQNIQQNTSASQYQQHPQIGGYSSDIQNYLMQQQNLTQQHRHQQQTVNYQPTHPSLYH